MSDDYLERRILHEGDPRGPGGRPSHGGDRGADLRHLDLHPGSAGASQGLRVFAERQPDASRAGDVLGRAGGGRTGPGVRVRAGGNLGRALDVAPGDEVVAAADLYGGTYRLLERVFKPWGLVARYTDDPRPEGFARLISPATRLVWIESPTNPLLQILDIAAIANLARRAGALLAVDNTFASPYLQQPLALGADLVVHSTTKYLGGHSDVVGGAVIGRRELLEPIQFTQNAAGGVPGPFDSWLVLRGIKTLSVRMDRHCANAATGLVAGRAVRRRAGLLSWPPKPPRTCGRPSTDARFRRHDQHPPCRWRPGGRATAQPDSPVQPRGKPRRRRIPDFSPRYHDPRQHPRRSANRPRSR